MAAVAGLQVYDEQGRLITEVTDRVPRIIGKIQVNRLDGYVDVGTDGEFFYQMIRLSDIKNDTPPTITQSSSRLSWTYNVSYQYRTDVIIVYGRY